MMLVLFILRQEFMEAHQLFLLISRAVLSVEIS